MKKKIEEFLIKDEIKIVRRRCLSSYSSQTVVMKHEQRCDQQKITAIETSNESHLYCKKPLLGGSIVFSDIGRLWS